MDEDSFEYRTLPQILFKNHIASIWGYSWVLESVHKTKGSETLNQWLQQRADGDICWSNKRRHQGAKWTKVFCD